MKYKQIYKIHINKKNTQPDFKNRNVYLFYLFISNEQGSITIFNINPTNNTSGYIFLYVFYTLVCISCNMIQ